MFNTKQKKNILIEFPKRNLPIMCQGRGETPKTSQFKYPILVHTSDYDIAVIMKELKPRTEVLLNLRHRMWRGKDKSQKICNMVLCV